MTDLTRASHLRAGLLALLPYPAPTGDPASLRRCAQGLDDAAGRISAAEARIEPALARGWRSYAAALAQEEIESVARALAREADRSRRAARAVDEYAVELEMAQAHAAEAERVLCLADDAQTRAELAAPPVTLASLPGADGRFSDPEAHRMLQMARAASGEAHERAQRAIASFVGEMEHLSGRRVERRGLTARVWVDAAAMLPVVGAPIDLVNGAVYAGQRRWVDSGLSLFGALPGPGDLLGLRKLGPPLLRRSWTVVDTVRPTVTTYSWLQSVVQLGNPRTTLEPAPPTPPTWVGGYPLHIRPDDTWTSAPSLPEATEPAIAGGAPPCAPQQRHRTSTRDRERRRR